VTDSREQPFQSDDPGSQVDVGRRPIGMFDSGMGGLTVLHQCLVKLPAEDFVYVGDTARFPYGSKTQEELERFSVQIASYLERSGVKLLVVACNSATAAALPLLQERFATPIVGAVMPGARAAVQSSRYRRIGVLATAATVATGSYVRAIRSIDSGAEVIQQSGGELARYIQEGDVASREVVDAVRELTAPLKERRVDVVIMGSTHYPLLAPMLERYLGPDVTLVNPAAEIVREVDEILRRQGIANTDGREGDYRFLCTGGVDEFRDPGARFLQMPLDDVEQLGLEQLDVAAS
jgi:glutamate racemase